MFIVGFVGVGNMKKDWKEIPKVVRKKYQTFKPSQRIPQWEREENKKFSNRLQWGNKFWNKSEEIVRSGVGISQMALDSEGSVFERGNIGASMQGEGMRRSE